MVLLGPTSRRDNWTTGDPVAIHGEVIALNDALVITRGGSTDLRVAIRDNPKYPTAGGGPATSDGAVWTGTDFMSSTDLTYPAFSLNRGIAAVGDISTIVYPQIILNSNYTFNTYGSIRIGYNINTYNQSKSYYNSALGLTELRDIPVVGVLEPARSMDMFNNTILYLVANKLIYMKRLPLDPKGIDKTIIRSVTLPAVAYPAHANNNMNSIKGDITIGPLGVTFLSDTTTIWRADNITANSFAPTWIKLFSANEIGESGVNSIYYKTIRKDGDKTLGYLTFNGASGNVYYYPFDIAGLTEYTL